MHGSYVRVPREIDFVVTSGGKKTYIQSAHAMDTVEKVENETWHFAAIRDSFAVIVVWEDVGKRWYDDNGVLSINVIGFLLDETLIWEI